jgi:ribosomal protein S10
MKKKAKMGRPKKKPADMHEKQVNIRLTSAEHRRLKKEAKEIGKSMGAILADPWRAKRKRERKKLSPATWEAWRKEYE